VQTSHSHIFWTREIFEYIPKAFLGRAQQNNRVMMVVMVIASFYIIRQVIGHQASRKNDL
jgi:hypothetical protein